MFNVGDTCQCRISLAYDFSLQINQSVEDLSELLNQSILCTFVIPKLLTTTTSFAQVQCGDESAQSLYFVKKLAQKQRPL